jgi:hypothetical protein
LEAEVPGAEIRVAEPKLAKSVRQGSVQLEDANTASIRVRSISPLHVSAAA